MSSRAALAVLTALALALTLALQPAPAQAARLKVLATFSLLADITARIAGDRAEVGSLTGLNTDAHLFQPSPKDVARLKAADLVVANGLGFEGWLERLVASSGYKGPVVSAGADVKPLPAPADKEHGGRKNRPDPHAWTDPGNGLLYGRAICRALVNLDPDGRAGYEARLAAFEKELTDIDAKARTAFAAMPQAARRVITTHDAFAYLGAAYGVEFISPLGVSTEAEPSAADVARIVRLMRAERIRAVFLENISNPKLIEQIAREGGAKPGGTLYSDALSGPEGPAATYPDLLRHNIQTLLEGLRLNLLP